MAASWRRQACRGCGWTGGGVLERGSEEKAKERGEWVARVFVVLLRERRERRALSRALHGGVEVAATGGLLGAWQGEERARREAKAAMESGRDAWKLPGKQEVAWGRPSAAGERCCRSAVRSRAASRQEEGENRLFCNFQKIPGT